MFKWSKNIHILPKWLANEQQNNFQLNEIKLKL